MKSVFLFFFSAVIFMGVVLPFSQVEAAGQPFWGPIVECGYDDHPCQFCDLAQLAQNLISVGISVATIIAVLLFVWAGFQYITAGGNESQIHHAHQIFWNVLIGFILLLLAWLIVDSIMKAFLNEDYGVWNKIQCVAQPTSTANQNCNPGTVGSTPESCSGGGGLEPVPPSVSPPSGQLEYGTPGCPTCEPVDPQWASLHPEQVDPRFNERLEDYHGKLATSDKWTITDAFNPGGGHTNPCHAGGMCIDMALKTGGIESGGLTQSEIDLIKSQQVVAAQAGLYAQYEVTSADGSDRYLQQLQDAGINVKNIPHATGDHSSVYYLK